LLSSDRLFDAKTYSNLPLTILFDTKDVRESIEVRAFCEVTSSVEREFPSEKEV
jgi:hypothetical protein